MYAMSRRHDVLARDQSATAQVINLIGASVFVSEEHYPRPGT